MSFPVLMSHVKDGNREKGIKVLQTFRTFLQYHIKMAKSNFHSRMRARVVSLIKVLNRAKVDVPDKDDKKTASGRTFKRAQFSFLSSTLHFFFPNTSDTTSLCVYLFNFHSYTGSCLYFWFQTNFPVFSVTVGVFLPSFPPQCKLQTATRDSDSDCSNLKFSSIQYNVPAVYSRLQILIK